MKLLEHTRKALSRLFAEAVPNDSLRLLYVRWRPPEPFLVAPDELEGVRKVVQDGLRSFIGLSFPNFAITVTLANEYPERAPAVQWQ